MAKCEEKQCLPTMPKFSPQICVFYRMEIGRTVSNQLVRTEYLIKQKPRGALVLQINRIADGRMSLKR